MPPRRVGDGVERFTAARDARRHACAPTAASPAHPSCTALRRLAPRRASRASQHSAACAPRHANAQCPARRGVSCAGAAPMERDRCNPWRQRASAAATLVRPCRAAPRLAALQPFDRRRPATERGESVRGSPIIAARTTGSRPTEAILPMYEAAPPRRSGRGRTLRSKKGPHARWAVRRDQAAVAA